MWHSRCAEFWPITRAITWWDTSQVQPASYLGTPAQELHLSKVPCPWWGGADGESPGIPQALWMPVSHIHLLLFLSYLGLEWIKSLPAWAINFETYVPIKIDLKKLWEDQAGLTISLLTRMNLVTQTQNKKTFWWCPDHVISEQKCKLFSLAFLPWSFFFLPSLYSLSWDVLTLFKEAFDQRAKLQNRRGRDGHVTKSFFPPSLCYRKALCIHLLHKLGNILPNLDSEFLPQWSFSGITIWAQISENMGQLWKAPGLPRDAQLVRYRLPLTAPAQLFSTENCLTWENNQRIPAP